MLMAHYPVPSEAGQEKITVGTAWLQFFFDQKCDPVKVRTAYRCRAYPDQAQQQMLARTFGCIRVVEPDPSRTPRPLRRRH
jgi:hypothetical protein